MAYTIDRSFPGASLAETADDVWSRADILTIVTACFLFCCIEREVESRLIEDGRFGIGHRKDRSYTASEGGLGDSIPIFFMGLSRFTHVDVRVNQAGKFYHVVFL